MKKTKKRLKIGTIKESTGKRIRAEYENVSSKDRQIQAKSPGKRRSKSGKIYFEARANRSDITRKKWAKGGLINFVFSKVKK